MPMYQLLGGKAAQFEAARLQWIGSMGGSNGLLYTWHNSKTKTIDDAKNNVVLLGGTGTNSDSHIFPTMINNLFGTRTEQAEYSCPNRSRARTRIAESPSVAGSRSQ